jgi:hypothetical protein
MTSRPYTDSILGRYTPFDTKVGDVICDTCGKMIIADVKLKDLHDLAWRIEGARCRHFKEMKEKENLRNNNWHAQCTLKWIPIIEQKLKEMGVF